MKNSYWNILFWIKAFFALAIALGTLGYYIFLVVDIREKAIALQEFTYSADPPSSNPSSNAFVPGGLSRLEPPNGKLLFGSAFDSDSQNPGNFKKSFGQSAAIYQYYIFFKRTGNTIYSADEVANFAKQVGAVGGILQLNVEISPDLYNLSPSEISFFALQMKRINSDFRVPVILRYGYGMNSYTQVDAAPGFINAFRSMTIAVRAQTNLTAMLWTPNLATAASNATTYSLYYPGDEYVDWVGLKLDYMYMGDMARSNSVRPDPNMVRNALNTFDFYSTYSASKNKPFCIAETGAAAYVTNDQKGYVGGTTEQDEIELKRAWWRQLYSSPSLYQPFPLIKAIVLLDQSRYETGAFDSDILNYKVVFGKSSVKDAFFKDIYNAENSKQIAYALNIRVGVNGILRIR